MPCILTPTNLIGVSRHYTVYPLIVQVNLFAGEETFFCEGTMGLFFCERGTSFWRKNSPSRALPPRNPLGVSCPAAQSARRDGCALRGTMGLFLREEDFFLEKELPLSRSPPKKPLGFSCPAAQRARRDGCALRGTMGLFFARGGLLSGERTPPLALSPQESRLGFPVPPRKARAGTDAPSRKRNKAASAAPFGRRMRPGGFLRRGVHGRRR